MYEGELVNGRKEGWGFYVWADGSKIEGFWLADNIFGIVTLL